MPSHDVFISYSSLDKPVADAACATLEARGVRCWIAPRDIRPAQDWSEAIIDAITDCAVFMLILSGASNQSEQVKREVQNAVGEGKPVLPFRIEEVALSKHMRYFIGTPHWLDALTPPMERHLQTMADVVADLVDAFRAKQSHPPRPDVLVHSDAPAPEALRPHAVSPEAAAAAGKALAPFLGPVAYALAKRAARTATGPEDLHRLLAEHLPSPAEKAAFLRAAPH